MKKSEAMRISHKIAVDLMTDGSSNPKVRASLVLQDKDGNNFGGWSFSGLRTRIEKHLMGEPK